MHKADTDGVVAQLVEHHNGIVGVRSSILLGSTIRGQTDSFFFTATIQPILGELFLCLEREGYFVQCPWFGR